MRSPSLIGFVAAALCAAHLSAVGLPRLQAAETAAAQTSNRDGVKITIAPRGFQANAQTWDFDVALETHTQPLNDDLVKSSKLFGDDKPYDALSWEGTPPGGHHRKGVLRFKAVVPPPQAVELQIRRTDESRPRSFRWQLK